MTSSSKTITFKLPVGAEYSMKLIEFRHSGNQISATIEAEPEVWEYIDMIMFFNLKWNDRNEGSVSGTKPVQIKIFLDKNLYTSLQSENKLLTDEKSFLEAETNHPMKGVLNWFATEVTEEIDLPESMKKMGTVREGFTTKWREEYQ